MLEGGKIRIMVEQKPLKKITVRELINKLIGCQPDWLIEIRDINGNKIENTKIVAIEPAGLTCLFG